MFGFFFVDGPVRSLEDAKASDVARFKVFFHSMLKRGIYLAPSPYEAGFVSLAHSEKDIEWTIECASWAFKELKA
jgi:glutamate-1-semialdehyde 2,1-aminomutase